MSGDFGSGATSRWLPRAIQITTANFVIFIFNSTSGTTGTWTDIPVGWTASYRP